MELISIVTTLYNYAHFIGDLAESILAQSHTNWEWIIVDDCSTDDPVSVLRPYIENSSRISLIRRTENRGYSSCKNKGIRTTVGKYIVMIDADDMLTPRSLELRLAAMKADPERLWCHGEVLVKSGERIGEQSRQWKRGFRKKLIGEGMDLSVAYHHRLIHAQSVMVKRQLHEWLGMYDPALRFSSDNEMWRRVIRFGHIPAHIEDFVAIYRVHDKRMSRSVYKRQRVAVVKAQIVKDVERRFAEGITAENTELW